jgi:AcrR family transcriptional regulator
MKKDGSKTDINKDKKDQRVVRTRKQVDAAFVDLLHRRAYGNIRVSDITKKAGVGRATFYAHYSSKDDLLRSQFNRIVVPMLVPRRDQPCPLDATALFAHLQSAPRIYKALIAGPEAGNSPRIMRQCFEACLQRAIEMQEGHRLPRSAESSIEQAIITRFLASALLAVVECGVEAAGQQSPQECQAIFARLAGGALAAARIPASETS